jgi:transposase-like protein
MAKRYSEQQWQDWFEEFQRSELPVGEFCDSIGVCVQTFYRWRRKLNVGSGEGFPRGQVMITSSPFVSISCPSPVIEFEFPGGVVARVSNDTQSLAPLVHALVDAGTPR